MLSRNTLFYYIYNNEQQQHSRTTAFTYHCNGGSIPQNNKAYQIKAKFDFYTRLNDKDPFQTAQKHYWCINLFFHRISLKRKVKYNVTEDLYGSPLVPRFTIELLQDNCVYLFSVQDLIRIIKTSLSAVANSWYPNPKMPCNPYTNKEFDKTHLHSIYAFAYAYCPRLLINSILLMAFQKSEFNLNVFSKNNHRLLLELFIDTLVAKDTTITVDLIGDILLMIKMHGNPFTPIEIQSAIDKKTLYLVFRPYLRLFYKITFLKCETSLTMLKRGLRNFALFNPLFGHTYYDFATKKVEVDVRCLSCGDFTEDNCVFDAFLKVRGHNETLCLPPIEGVYYFPPKIHVLEKTVLERLPSASRIELFDEDLDNEDEYEDEDTCDENEHL